MNSSTPSASSSTQKQEERSPIDITRLLYLSSAPLKQDESPLTVPIKASQSLSPANKTWIIPPHQDDVTMFKINLRNLHIFHTWPSVRKELLLVLRNTGGPPGTGIAITIPRGNWDAVGLSEFINEQFKAQPYDNEITFHSSLLSFSFKNPIDIAPPTSLQTLRILGIPQPSSTSSWIITNHSQSQIPIKLSGPSCIHVNIDQPLYNIPSSGRLATIGVSVCYGDLLLYFDESGTQPPLLTSQYLSNISIQLTDENNEELECYDDIPWQCVLCIDPVEQSGFNSLETAMKRPNIENL